MKKIIILLCTMLAIINANAQGCLPEGITFTTQAQINNFQNNYPGCTEIEGNVQISGLYNITNLNGLSVLTSIGGNLIIQESFALTSLTGLENLTAIGGGMWIESNYTLASLTGLENLTSMGGNLFIFYNSLLEDLTALDNLQSSTIGNLYIVYNSILSGCNAQSLCYYLVAPNGTVEIHDNAPGCNSQLEIEELCNLQSCLPEGITFTTQEQIDIFQINYPGCTEIEGDVIIFDGNPGNITNLNGLSVLTSIGGNLTIADCILTNLSGLGGIEQIGGDLEIYANALTSLTGLEGLATIGGYIQIGDGYFGGNWALTSLAGLVGLTSIGGGLFIVDNDSLATLTGLEGLTSIGGGFHISLNDALTSLTGLDNIIPTTIEYISILDNSSLAECDVYSICQYLITPNGFVEIYNNDSGCDNPAEIATSCGFQIPCLPYGNYYFTSQEDIDNFQTNYPGCSEIDGDVTISGDDITNLNGLSVVTSIEGSLCIGNWYAAGGNPLLTSLEGLEGLSTIGGTLFIGKTYSFYVGNPLLTNFTGLEGLASIGGNLLIFGNEALTSFTGLDGLTSIGGELYFSDNDALTSLTGLDELTSIGNSLTIWLNDALTSLTGLEGLTSLGGHLFIFKNSVLTNLIGLEGLTSIGGGFNISLNDALTSLTGLDNIQANSITALIIHENSTLEECDVYSICQYLVAPNGTIEIYDNAPGCNNPEEVQEHCLTTLKEVKTVNGITIIPNPSNDKITISSSALTGNTELTIFNVSGEKVIERQLTDTETQIDISALPRGVYFVRVQDEKLVEVGKMVKE